MFVHRSEKERSVLKKQVEPFSRTLFTRDILHHLRKQIILGQITPGSRIIENQLAEEFNVSRGPIRVALQSLEQEGLVEWLSNGGTRVVGFSLKSAEDMMDFRLLTERRALEIAIEHPDTNFHALLHVVDLMQSMNRQEEINDLTKAITMVDIQFHRSLLIMADNEFMLRSWNALANVLYTVLSITNTQHENFQEYYAEHKVMADLIVQRSRKAMELLESHIASSKQLLIARLRELRSE